MVAQSPSQRVPRHLSGPANLYRLRWVLWVGLLLVSTALRFAGPDWDAGIAAHPDERYLLGVAAAQPLYTNVCATAPDFPYGHLPVTLGRILALTAPDADPLYAGRLLSGLAGVLLVAVSGACGIALAGWRGGLVAVAVAAFAPSLIQAGHTYTVDPFAALFVSGAVLAARCRRWRASGALMGLAVACKASAAVAVLPILAAALLVGGEGRPSGGGIRSRLWGAARSRSGRRRAVQVGAGALLVFAVVSPWSLLTPVACWRGPIIQSLLVSGRFEVPYTLQYAGTWPFIYPLIQMGLWGLGPTATLFGLGGLISGLWAAWRGARRSSWADAMTAGWTLLLFLSIGALHVKFPRYMYLLYPWWIAWAAYFCLGRAQHRTPSSRLLASGCRGRAVALLLLVGVTLLFGLAQASIYTQPHPWQAASEWLFAHLPPGALITVEAWDHPLPVPLGAEEASQYTQLTLPIFEEDDADKAHLLEMALRDETTVIVASRRGYGALARHPERYAGTMAWYHELFSSREAIVFSRCPRLGPVALTDDPLRDAGLPQAQSLAQRCGTLYALRLPRLDESHRVYDAPFVLLLRR